MASNVTDAIRAALAADVTLSALLTGGVYASRSNKVPISHDSAAYVKNAQGIKVLQPCAAVHELSDTPVDPLGDHARTLVMIQVFDAQGYATTSPALYRIRDILDPEGEDGVRIAFDDGSSLTARLQGHPIRQSISEDVLAGGSAGEPASYEAGYYEVDWRW